MIEKISSFAFKIDKLIEVLTPSIWYKNLNFYSLLALIFTLIVLIIYTIGTYKIAIQTKESNLRPVILRQGYIQSWENIKYKIYNENRIKGTLLEFIILKNIATDISGYIIKNGFKYKLFFGNEISRKNNKLTFFNESWGWLNNSGVLYSYFIEKDKKQSKKPNQIVINYKDIEGNSYLTRENENFKPKSFKKRKNKFICFLY